jgi:hypothetical protein
VGSIPSAGKIFENQYLADSLPSKNCQELASCFRATNRSLTYSGKFTQEKPPGNLRISPVRCLRSRQSSATEGVF